MARVVRDGEVGVRRVVLDTETTGGSHKNGDRICEVGMVETVDHIPTGKVFHAYINPERKIHWAATRVHGMTLPMLSGCPVFEDIAAEAREFIGEDLTLAHNSKFDGGFMNMEFSRINMAPVNRWQDTVRMCEKARPGGSHKLDAMVKRLGIVTPDRKIHGALLDAAILAAVVARIHGAPEVDIQSLAEKGLRMPTRTPASSSRPSGSRSARTSPAEADSQKKSYSRDGEDSLRQEAGALVSRVRQAYTEAADVTEFLMRLEAMGVQVRPNVGTGGKLTGFRFRTENLYAVGSEVGLCASHFEHGRMTYDPSLHSETLNRMKAAYDKTFGPTSEERNTRLLSGRFGVVAQVPVEGQDEGREVSQAIAGDVKPEVKALISEINGQPPATNFDFYKELRSGRDVVSTMSIDDVLAAIPDQARQTEAFKVIQRFPEREFRSSLRWIMRGLSPDHALGMLVATQKTYNKQVPGDIIEVAEEVLGSNRETEPDF